MSKIIGKNMDIHLGIICPLTKTPAKMTFFVTCIKKKICCSKIASRLILSFLRCLGKYLFLCPDIHQRKKLNCLDILKCIYDALLIIGVLPSMGQNDI
jgi:hypothetical protein